MLASGMSAGAPDGNSVRRYVLILNGADANLPAFVVVDRAAREEIRGATNGRVDFFSESLDLLRFPGAEIESELEALLRKKYARVKIDVVVASGRVAREFAERNVEELWPAAAIVFLVDPSATSPAFTPGPRTTGVAQEYDVAGTIALALRLRPQTRRIVVVGGASPNDQMYVSLARRELERYRGRLAIDFLVGLPLPETLATLKKAEPDAIVLFLTMARDGAGVPHWGVDVAKEVAAASPVPVFAWQDTYMGQGIVGGALGNYATEARKAGQVVVRVLNGEHPQDIPVQRLSLSACAVDARELARFGIAERLLPEDCSVRFKPRSLWDLYRWQILGGLAIMLAQTVLIVALMIQRHRRQRAEVEVEERRAELAHAMRLATVGELTASIAHEVNQPLGAILAKVHSADLLLESERGTSADLRRILADIRNEDLRASEVIRRLRALLAKHAVTQERVSLNEVIVELARLLEPEARRRSVRLVMRLDSALPPVDADRVHIEQVILNLVLNGMDAMADTAVDRRQVMVQTSVRASGEVEVAVIDAGPGVPPDRLEQVFKPYFTTKERGMGLGLPISRTIIEAHGGRIWAEADRGGGGTFRFTLPVSGDTKRIPAQEHAT